MWVDPNLSDFYERIARIEKAHAKGYGFEAPGTIAKPVQKPGLAVRVLRIVKPLMMVALLAVGMKGTIHYFIGNQTYETRIAALSAGEGIDPVGAWLMHPDPLTLYVSAQLQALWPR